MLFRKAYNFCSQQPLNPFQAFKAVQCHQLKVQSRVKGRTKLGNKVMVPYNALMHENVLEFFSTIHNQQILVNVDPSHQMGMSRLLQLQYLRTNIYKGITQAPDLLSKENPSNQLTIDQLRFDSNMFFQTDPEFEKQRQSMTLEQYDTFIGEHYQQNLQRGRDRLEAQYKIPHQYLSIMEAAHNNNNEIYFSGVNQYSLRTYLCSSLKLSTLKAIFFRCLGYCCNKSSQLDQFHRYCREYLWESQFDLMIKLENQRIRYISKVLPTVMVFAHSYSYTRPGSDAELDLKTLGEAEVENDVSRIEKAAILEVMLGLLWGQPYTHNPFPYITDEYAKLGSKDQQSLRDIYNQHYKLYWAATKAFYKAYKPVKQDQDRVIEA